MDNNIQNSNSAMRSFQDQIVQHSATAMDKKHKRESRLFSEYLRNDVDDGLTEFMRMENRVIEMGGELNSVIESDEVTKLFGRKKKFEAGPDTGEKFRAYMDKVRKSTIQQEPVLQSSRAWGLTGNEAFAG